MRRDVEFTSGQDTIRGWLYTPDEGEGPHPAIVLAGGWCYVKELVQPYYAEMFARAGFAALLFDYRNFGSSDGARRQHIDPVWQVEDYKNAISFAETLPEVDAERIGVWGLSYSGGHVLVVAAIDRRVRCVVSQVPLVSGIENARRLIRADAFAGLRAAFDADRAARYAGKEPEMIPVVFEDDPASPAALPTADSSAFFLRFAERAPLWRNEVTLRSVEMFTEYEPGDYLPRISPTPLLMVVAAGDHLTVSDLTTAAFERAREPKQLLVLPGGHFDAYTGTAFETSSSVQRDFLVQHLGT